MRDYINAPIGFQALADATGAPPKSLMRMFGTKGNPQARHLLGVIAVLQAESGIHFEVHAVSDAA